MADHVVETLENSVTEHVSKADLTRILARAGRRSWAAMHEAAHRLDDSGDSDIEKPALDDIIAVASQMENERQPFPGDDEALYVAVNHVAAQVPHR